MRSGDVVRATDGRKLRLVVGVVDGDQFMALGWPPALEYVCDFEVTEEATDDYELEVLVNCVKIGLSERSIPDWRALTAQRQLRARGLGPSLLGDATVPDDVGSPAHYHLPDGRQAWELIEAELGLRAAIDYHRGAEMKYQLRAGRKPGATAEQDLAKAAAHRLRILDLQIAVRDGTPVPRPPMPREAR